MSTQRPVDTLTISGFRSLRNVELRLGQLNVLIGPNGSGKSNLVSFFGMLAEMVEGRLQLWTRTQGTADRVLSYGSKATPSLKSHVAFGRNAYRLELHPTVDGGFAFAREEVFFDGPYYGPQTTALGSGHAEALLKSRFQEANPESIFDYCYSSISSWKTYHFHDTSSSAGINRWGSAHHSEYLEPDASNIAAYLFRVASEDPELYCRVRDTIRLAVPFFDGFSLKPETRKNGEEQLLLFWRQKDSRYRFLPSQLSDGSLRFICLTAALMQPNPPSTIIIDEPELGLHPYAITLLGSLLRAASLHMQVIVSTQSVPLVNEFEVDDLVVVEMEDGESVFTRYRADDFQNWLESYSLGELWEKNLLGGRPHG